MANAGIPHPDPGTVIDFNVAQSPCTLRNYAAS